MWIMVRQRRKWVEVEEHQQVWMKSVYMCEPVVHTHPSRKLSDLIFAISPSPMSSQEASRGRAVCAEEEV